MHVIAAWMAWAGLGIVVYAFAGYALVLALAGRRGQRLTVAEGPRPTVSLVIAACDEAPVLAAKLENTLALEYPAELLEIIVVTDGSRDETPAIASAFGARGVRAMHAPARRGKNHAVKRAVAASSGAIVVLTDANTFLNPDALGRLVRHFDDPGVGMVAGAKCVTPCGRPAGQGESGYWRYEGGLKRLESRVGSVMGAAGELLAVRRTSWSDPPEGTIIEDFWLTLSVMSVGLRVVYEPEARAVETPASDMAAERERKVRIVAGGWQAILAHRALLHPRNGWIAFQLFSHRVLRWMVIPFVLPALPVLAALGCPEPGMPTLTAACAGGLVLAAWGWKAEGNRRTTTASALAYWLASGNLAAIQGAWRYWTRTQPAVWRRPVRTAERPL